MKTTLRIVRLLAAGALLSAVTACGGLSYQVEGRPPATGADATIKGDVDADTNTTRIDVEVENLAPASRLKSGTTHFVVWQRANKERQWQRVGVLDYDEGKRSGSLKKVTVPETAFDLVVTIEKGASPATPSSDVVFQQRVAKD